MTAIGEVRSGTRVKVLYVMGAGRSGSTILGVALGNCDGVCFAGELDKWFARAGTPRRDGAELAAFWAAANERVGDARDVFAGRTGWLERSSALLDPRKRRERRRLRPRYREVSQRLYEAVAEVSGDGCVVDTSHYPLRARELKALGGIELYVVLLVRDPHSVVASLGRRDVVERRFGALAANAYLWLTYLLSALVYARQPRERRIVVRHEELLADPSRTLRRVLELAGVDAAPPDLDALATGVPFHGNRLLDAPRVSLRAGESQPGPRRLLTSAVQWPWRLVFRHYTAASR